jgi:peptidoglycan hydrolase-like protein with peptidoglycan-binding domain
VRTDLAQTEELDGTLGYGDAVDLPNQAQGTLTNAAQEGTVLASGDIAYEVDEKPVFVLQGTTPAWRTLSRGVDDGADVAQLQQYLIAAGYLDADTDEADLGADGHFDAATQAAVEDWQEDQQAYFPSVADDGVVQLGSVIFTPVALRVAETPTGIGAPTGSSVLSVTGTTQVVTVDLDADRRDLLPVGTHVDVELPDGSTVGAEVSAVATTADATDDGRGGQGTPTIQVTFTLDAPVDDYVSAPVHVEVTRASVTGVLAVPVSALLALAEGGYAVQVLDDAGGSSLVGVDLGTFADGLVEVTGELAEGDVVAVPR